MCVCCMLIRLSLCDFVRHCGLYSPPGSSVHGILQARILEWVAMPPPGDLSDPGIKPRLLTLLHWQAGYLPTERPGKSHIHIHVQTNT